MDSNQLSIYRKMVILIAALLIPILILYGYSNYSSIKVVEEEIKSSNLKQLMFFLHQLETNLEQLNQLAVFASRDSQVREFKDFMIFKDNYEITRDRLSIEKRLTSLSVSNSWNNVLSVYFMNIKQIISTNPKIHFDDIHLNRRSPQKWSVRQDNFYDDDLKTYSFYKRVVEPWSVDNDVESAKLVVEVSFSEKNIVSLLDKFKQGGTGDPFFFHPSGKFIYSSTSRQESIGRLSQLLTSEQLGDGKGYATYELGNDRYLVFYVRSEKLDGWYLVDYVPVQEVLRPITNSRNLFYVSVIFLLVLSVIAALLLYRHVQVPILRLIRSLQRFSNGDYATRIDAKTNIEFTFVFQKFNEMAEKIQFLIEKVYEEEIRSREATLKHLQSQINPHFLYNCLFFIKNLVGINDHAVESMAMHLGEYYRYTTRLENPLASLRDEVQLLNHYLKIQQYRSDRIHFQIEIPDQMMDLQIPRLMIQPIVENCIIHGIEKKEGIGLIHITGEEDTDYFRITVEDNGAGMTKEELEQIQIKLLQPLQEGNGCGVWNVHQRLVYQYGKGSELLFDQSALGGLKVTLKWKK
ncbi:MULTISPECIES: sensor histidine kinase [unclassified Paenibacillus]|uniref:sensor histidine kinase n=1 Tax=unclassified Paenibacillus TaxID=185978 RepID=UPI0036257593